MEHMDWNAASEHFYAVMKIYEGLLDKPGVYTGLALAAVFKPISERYQRGERTSELFEDMMSVE